MIDFQVEAVAWGNSYLISQLKGHLYQSHFYYVWFRYMAILTGSQLFSDYVSAVTLQFSFNGTTGTNISTITTAYPTIYDNMGSLMVVKFLRDARMDYPKAGLEL